MPDEVFFPRSGQSVAFECAQILMSKILPVPRSTVPIEEILNFKRTHNNELLRFRLKIDQFERELAMAQTKTDMRNITVRFLDEIQLGINDISASLSDWKISTTLGSLTSLLSISSPPLLAAAEGIFGHFPIAVTVGVTVFAGTIQIGSYFVDQRNQRRAELRKSPFSYVYTARELT